MAHWISQRNHANVIGAIERNGVGISQVFFLECINTKEYLA